MIRTLWQKSVFTFVLCLVTFLQASITVPFLMAQESLITDSPEPPTTENQVPDSEDSPVESETSMQEDTMFTRSLELDIASSELDELIAWSRVLELNTSGTEETLRNQLRDYYNLKSSSTTPEPGPPGKQVVIESARRSEYFTLDVGEGEEESIVKLTGDVILSMHEPSENRTHRVKADSILFNEQQKTISATGNIEYVLKTGDDTQEFTGDSLTFSVSDWTGVIFQGTVENEQEIDDQTFNFIFSGEVMKRSSDKILVLSDGTVTSDPHPNPEYSIRAKKIWITAPGRWALLSATVYVGHVPVLYLPFYWKTGQDLFFNPVIGFKDRWGYYLQTTIYLIGSKDDNDDTSIFNKLFRFDNSSGKKFRFVREGIYLVRKPIDEDEEKSKGTLKYTLDGYSNLGFAMGLSGSFPDLTDDTKLDFLASLALSRSINDKGNPYFLEGRETRMYWNSSNIGKTTLPFRWGSFLNFDISNWKFHFDWYSDPYYNKDFGTRREHFDWITLFLGEDDDTDDKNKNSTTSTMKWEISGSETFNFDKTSPWLKSIALSRFRSSLIWNKKNNTAITGSDSAYNPAREFFYPYKFVLPDFKISIKGALPSYEILSNQKQDNEETEQDAPTDDEEISKTSLFAPKFIDSYRDPVGQIPILGVSLSYSLDSDFLMEDYSDNANWNKPADIDENFKPAKINTTHIGKINYTFSFLDGIIDFGGVSKFSGYYQIHTDIFENAPLIKELGDLKYTKFLWEHDNLIRFKPLKNIPSLKQSSLDYVLDIDVFTYQFNETATVDDPLYDSKWFSETDDIRNHHTTAAFIWSVSPLTLKSSLKANIPPLGQKYNIDTSAAFAHAGWKAEVSQNNEYKDGEWDIKPLSASLSWTGWKNELTLSQTAKYDVEDYLLMDMESLLKIWGFQTQFVAKRDKTYNWENFTWVEQPEAFVPSTLKFSFNRSMEIRPQWKNRIRFKTTVDTSWNIDLRRPTDNVLTFKLVQSFKIHRFLDLSFSLSSTNKSMYLYFPWWREQLGIRSNNNFFEDLLKSFNIFNREDLLDSQFNIDKIDISLIHHLRNWDVSVEFSGSPVLKNNQYEWKPTFTFFVQWNPLPLFNQETKLKDEKWKVKVFETSESDS